MMNVMFGIDYYALSGLKHLDPLQQGGLCQPLNYPAPLGLLRHALKLHRLYYFGLNFILLENPDN